MYSNEVASRAYGPKVYLDMDGVLADFDGELVNRGLNIDRVHSRLNKQFVSKEEWTKEETESESKIHEFMSEDGFFRNLRLLEGAGRLWVAAGKPIILTARPKKDDPANRVRREKREWIEEHFGQIPEDRFICCLRSEKARYAREFLHEQGGSPSAFPNILVDDLEWNCSEWEKAGGLAILFKNADQAIKELKLATN